MASERKISREFLSFFAESQKSRDMPKSVRQVFLTFCRIKCTKIRIFFNGEEIGSLKMLRRAQSPEVIIYSEIFY